MKSLQNYCKKTIDGVLIQTAMPIPIAMEELRSKIRQGLEELDSGKGVPGTRAEAELKAMSKALRQRRHK
jgi:hypothetical protein